MRIPNLSRLLPASLLVPMLALALAAPARGDGTPEAAAIRTVIEAQLAAFQRDDGAEAFSYAAPEIQAQFGTPERFMQMVKLGYAPVYRPRQVFFQELLVHDGRHVQPLLVTGHDGRVVIALYTMERQADGMWRIAGVVLLPAAAQGA